MTPPAPHANQSPQSARSGMVVSDLHLFSPRSAGEARWAECRDALTGVDVLVLNGDIFDFQWSRYADHAATTAAALAWLEALLAEKGGEGREVHYLLGNHDCVEPFAAELDALEQREGNFWCHETTLKLGPHFFLHGDCANRSMDDRELRRYRSGWRSSGRRGALGRVLYEQADAIGLTRRAHDWYFPQKRTVRRVAYHLDHVRPDWRDEIEHCYFGHTHLPFTGHRHEGVTFHNTGCGIRGMGFAPARFGWRSGTEPDRESAHEGESS